MDTDRKKRMAEYARKHPAPPRKKRKKRAARPRQWEQNIAPGPRLKRVEGGHFDLLGEFHADKTGRG